VLSTGKLLIKIAAFVFVPALLVAIALGYSGSAQLAGIGNTLLLLAMLLCLPIAVVGAVMWLAGRSQPG
jgi:lincosamide nucleotidyltransferase A/C/D/E